MGRSKFMIGLLVGTFAFFWTHTALWFYREYKDRKARKTRQHVDDELPRELGKQYRALPRCGGSRTCCSR